MKKICEVYYQTDYYAVFAVFFADTAQAILNEVNGLIEIPSFDLCFTTTVQHAGVLPIFLILRQNSCAQVCYCIFDVNNIEEISVEGCKRLQDENIVLISSLLGPSCSALESKHFYHVLEMEHVIFLSQF